MRGNSLDITTPKGVEKASTQLPPQRRGMLRLSHWPWKCLEGTCVRLYHNATSPVDTGGPYDARV